MAFEDQVTVENYPHFAVRTEAPVTPEMLARLSNQENLANFLETLACFISMGQILDAYKKHFFYGKELNIQVSELAHVDAAGAAQRLFGSEKLVRLLHAIIGIDTEATEFSEHLLAVLNDGAELDETNLGEESGDLNYYNLGMLHDILGLNPLRTLRKNIGKLHLRYPQKFTAECALNRDLAAERALLEA